MRNRQNLLRNKSLTFWGHLSCRIRIFCLDGAQLVTGVYRQTFGGRLRIFCSKPSDVASYAFCDRSVSDRSGNDKADVPGLEWRLVQCFYIYADAGGLCIQKFLDRTCVLDTGNDCSHLLYGT